MIRLTLSDEEAHYLYGHLRNMLVDDWPRLPDRPAHEIRAVAHAESLVEKLVAELIAHDALVESGVETRSGPGREPAGRS